MWRIVKGKEPRCLPALRETEGATWEGVHGDQKQEMREALCRDQGGLCAYCQSRIATRDGEPGPLARVEHWETRASAPDRMFAWENLLGVCLGDAGDGAPPEPPRPVPGHPETAQVDPRYHCDNHRGHLPVPDQALRLRLTGPMAAGRVRFDGAGHLWSDNPDLQHDIEVLNLNIWRLVRNRKAAVALAMRVAGTPPRAARLKNLLERVEARGEDGLFAEYAAAIAYQARRKLQRAASLARG